MESSLQFGHTDRGFGVIRAENYPNEGIFSRVVQESSLIGEGHSIIGEGHDPGSSFLWVGPDHHLNREEVRQLIEAMQNWLYRGRLIDSVKAKGKSCKCGNGRCGT